MAIEKLTPSSGNDRPIGWVSISKYYVSISNHFNQKKKKKIGEKKL